ncbi:unnamed protein product [Caenorhabditis sp. 36 PRJEB53466]|nr:unnamed protein product [Caenorhabditis sp. 36 PRJEB53466]
MEYPVKEEDDNEVHEDEEMEEECAELTLNNDYFDNSWLSSLNSLMTNANGLVMIERSFATAMLPMTGPSKVDIVEFKGHSYVLSVANTSLFIYCLKPEGGNMKLDLLVMIKQHDSANYPFLEFYQTL